MGDEINCPLLFIKCKYAPRKGEAQKTMRVGDAKALVEDIAHCPPALHILHLKQFFEGKEKWFRDPESIEKLSKVLLWFNKPKNEAHHEILTKSYAFLFFSDLDFTLKYIVPFYTRRLFAQAKIDSVEQRQKYTATFLKLIEVFLRAHREELLVVANMSFNQPSLLSDTIDRLLKGFPNAYFASNSTLDLSSEEQAEFRDQAKKMLEWLITSTRLPIYLRRFECVGWEILKDIKEEVSSLPRALLKILENLEKALNLVKRPLFLDLHVGAVFVQQGKTPPAFIPMLNEITDYLATKQNIDLEYAIIHTSLLLHYYTLITSSGTLKNEKDIITHLVPVYQCLEETHRYVLDKKARKQINTWNKNI